MYAPVAADPIVLAHRGLYGSSSHRWRTKTQPAENTYEAFEAAARQGCTYIETDVQATRDDVVVAFHDDTLAALTGHCGTVADLTWHEVSQLDVHGGGSIPRLDEAFRLWPELRWNLDVKVASAIDPLATLIEDSKTHDRVCVASFSDARRRAVRDRLTRPVATSAGVGSVIRSVVAATVLPNLAPPDVDFLQVPASFVMGPVTVPVVTRRFVSYAQRHGIGVHVWTVNDEREAQALLDLGVDGLVTDRPQVMRPLVAAHARGSAATV